MVDKVKLKTTRRMTASVLVNEHGKKVFSIKLLGLFGKNDKFTVEHMDKGARN